MATATMNTNGPASIISWQDDQLRTKNFQLLGYVWKVVLEAARGAAVPQHSVAQSVGSAMDWYGMESYQGQNLLPQIAQTRDGGSLLLLDPVVRPDGQVGLPDIPDPQWRPPVPSNAQLTGKKAYTPPKAPMIPQHLYEEDANHQPVGRARGQLVGTRFLVFGPVQQILIRPVKLGEQGQTMMLPEAWILQCKLDPATNKYMEMLIHQDTGQAYFYGGKFDIKVPK
jgi:hypothetical protein